MENNLTTNIGSEVTLLILGSPHQGGSEGKYSHERGSFQPGENPFTKHFEVLLCFNNSRKVALVISRTLLAGFQGRSAFCLVRRAMWALH